MLEIYNSKAITKNQRFVRAIIAGVVSAVVIGILYGFIQTKLMITFEIFFVAMGYAIGMAIQTMGRGVQQRFSVLGAICAVLCFVIADIVSYFGLIGLAPALLPFTVKAVIAARLSLNPWALIGLLFRGIGVATAYQYSRII